MKTHDLAGERFGSLVARRPLGPRGNKCRSIVWLCDCDCGNVHEVRSNVLITGRSRSCGCKHWPRGQRSSHWDGVGSIPRAYWKNLMSGAASRGIEVSIAIEDGWRLFVAQGGRCALTGRAIIIGSPREVDVTASVDRIDPTVGYHISNIQWVHKDVNGMKMAYGQEYFIQTCCEIADHYRRHDAEIRPSKTTAQQDSEILEEAA